jgi:hypothetical protein
VSLDPSLLRGDFGLKIEDTGEHLPREYLWKCYQEHREQVGVLQDLERGIITLGVQDYENLPAILIESWLLFKHILAEHRGSEVQALRGIQ